MVYKRTDVQRKKEVSTIDDFTGRVGHSSDRWRVPRELGRQCPGSRGGVLCLVPGAAAAVEVAQVVRESWSSLVTSAAHWKRTIRHFQSHTRFVWIWWLTLQAGSSVTWTRVPSCVDDDVPSWLHEKWWKPINRQREGRKDNRQGSFLTPKVVSLVPAKNYTHHPAKKTPNTGEQSWSPTTIL